MSTNKPALLALKPHGVKKNILIILILMGTTCIYRDQWGHVHTRIHFLIRTTVPLEKYLSVLRVLAVWDKLCCQAPLVLQ